MKNSMNMILAGTAGLTLMAQAAGAVELELYFPIAVAGAASETIESLIQDYMTEHPDVDISAVYAGSYLDTRTRVFTAARSGDAPQLAILLSTDMFSLIDEEIILPWDDFVTPEELDTWIGGFYPAFMLNSQSEGKTWGIPFQRSTPVLFRNHDAFEAAGLDPETPPATWDEMLEFAKKLTVRDASGTVTQWGVRIPSSSIPSWLFTGLVAANGQDGLSNDAGTEVYFDTPEVVEALEYLVSLSKEHEVMAPGILEWGATPRAFLDAESAMVWTSTGNLVNIGKNATFEFGVAMLPANERRGAPTGGGNFYLFDGSTDEQIAASVDFVKWATAPEQAATWAIATGYVAPREDTWATERMQVYTQEVPGALVARDQLAYAVREVSTFEGTRVSTNLDDNISAAIVGDKTPAQAMADAQAEADAVLAPYR